MTFPELASSDPVFPLPGGVDLGGSDPDLGVFPSSETVNFGDEIWPDFVLVLGPLSGQKLARFWPSSCQDFAKFFEKNWRNFLRKKLVKFLKFF
jgi:hypothetical protein